MLEAKEGGKDSFNIPMPHGTLVVSLNTSVTEDGALFKYDYNVNTADAAVNALTSKESLPDTFSVNVVHSGASSPESSAEVTITIHGVNDRPSIAVHPAEDSSHTIITYTEDFWRPPARLCPQTWTATTAVPSHTPWSKLWILWILWTWPPSTRP